MRTVAVGFLAMLGYSVTGSAAVQTKPESGQTEIRFMIFDRHGMPIDVKPTSGSIEVWPEDGSKHSYSLETVPPSGGAEGATKETRGRSKMQERHSGMVCGQIRDTGPFQIEMAVCTHSPKSGAEEKGKGMGRLHDHGAGYLKAMVPTADLANPKNGTINFKAHVNISMAGKTETIKGFDYPEGCIETSLDRFVDYDLKDIADVAKLDPDRVQQLSQRIQSTLENLPPLSFKTPEDRSQYEKAVNECRESSIRLAGAHGADLSTIANECRDKCKDVMSQAKDAQGALKAE
jgi:hypothetical protein